MKGNPKKKKHTKLNADRWAVYNQNRRQAILDTRKQIQRNQKRRSG